MNSNNVSVQCNMWKLKVLCVLPVTKLAKVVLAAQVLINVHYA